MHFCVAVGFLHYAVLVGFREGHGGALEVSEGLAPGPPCGGGGEVCR